MNKYGMNKLKNECNMAIIRLTGINKIYRVNEIETQALENVNLEVEKGEFLSVMGPSGCGKSTLLNIIGLLDAPTSGTLELNRNVITLPWVTAGWQSSATGRWGLSSSRSI